VSDSTLHDNVKADNAAAAGPATAHIAREWGARTLDLAKWTKGLLVNRTDVWGGYLPFDKRNTTYTAGDKVIRLDKSVTRPPKARRGQQFLDLGYLASHYRGRAVECLIGLHSTSPDNLCRWIAPDIDQHGDGGPDPAANWRAAQAWYERARSLGFRPLLTDSNGRGGYHGPMVIFKTPVPSKTAYAFAWWLTDDYAEYGLTDRPEIFPKQAELGEGRYGNWLRLPGRHHTRDHWSRVWDGERWLDGAEAVAFILALEGDDPALIPGDIKPPRRRAQAVRRHSVYHLTAGNALESRIRGYMATLPHLGEGQGRDDVAYNFAAWLTRDMQLSDDDALPWLVEWDKGNTPPKGEDRLREILKNAREYGQRAFGCGLGEPSANGHQQHADHPEPDATAAADTAPPDPRSVLLSVNEHQAVELVSTALARWEPSIFCRGCQLVRVLRDSRPGAAGGQGLTRPAGAPRIAPLPPAKLRCLITRNVELTKYVENKDGDIEEVPAHPTEWLVKGIDAAGDWSGMRHLEAITEAPLLRRDGSILQERGYDPASGVLYDPSEDFPRVPDEPTREDAIRARDELLEPLADFPFASEAHKAVILAAMITLLARFAFDGPAPLFFITANTRGTGKGLLCDVIAVIVLGRPFARAAYSRDDDEMRKVILSLAIEGDRAVLLDNIAGTFGGPALDAALTAVEWSGRELGKSKQLRLPLVATWFATANNPVIGADSARRVCECRLESPEERPEEREGFRHPDLLAWVRRERGRLLVAALTILSAYCRAGRPDMRLKPWGSYEGWSALPRSAVVWAGLPDPGETRQELVERADTEAQALAGLLAGWEEIDPEGRGVTTSQALKAMKAEPEKYATLRAVLTEVFECAVGELPSAQRLGKLLRKFVGRIVDGRCFAAREGPGKVSVWTVRQTRPKGGGCGSGGSCGSAQPDPNAHAGAHARAHTRDDTEPGSNTPATPATPPADDPAGVYYHDLPL
jgi:hypothetical protein